MLLRRMIGQDQSELEPTQRETETHKACQNLIPKLTTNLFHHSSITNMF